MDDEWLDMEAACKTAAVGIAVVLIIFATVLYIVL